MAEISILLTYMTFFQQDLMDKNKEKTIQAHDKRKVLLTTEEG